MQYSSACTLMRLQKLACVAAACGAVGLISGCANAPGQGVAGPTAAGYGVPIDCNAAARGHTSAINLKLTGLGPLGGIVRKAEADQRKEEAQQRAAAARECAPHPMPVLYTGVLTPVADVKSVVKGKTIYLDTAVVANHQFVRMNEDEMFLASDGKSYSSSWSAQPWYVDGNSVCITGKQPTCMPMFSDSDNKLYMTSPAGLLLKLAHTETGDSAHVKEAYAENMRDQAKREAMAGALIGLFLTAVTSGGGGGGSRSGSVDRISEDQAREAAGARWSINNTARQNGQPEPYAP